MNGRCRSCLVLGPPQPSPREVDDPARVAACNPPAAQPAEAETPPGRATARARQAQQTPATAAGQLWGLAGKHPPWRPAHGPPSKRPQSAALPERPTSRQRRSCRCRPGTANRVQHCPRHPRLRCDGCRPHASPCNHAPRATAAPTGSKGRWLQRGHPHPNGRHIPQGLPMTPHKENRRRRLMQVT